MQGWPLKLAVLCSCSLKRNFDSLPCADCTSFLQRLPLGQTYQLGFNTISCRSLHTHTLPVRPAVHCPHAGKNGGDSFRDWIYTEAINADPFTAGPYLPSDIMAGVTAETALAGLSHGSGNDLHSACLLLAAYMHVYTMKSYTMSLHAITACKIQDVPTL